MGRQRQRGTREQAEEHPHAKRAVRSNSMTALARSVTLDVALPLHPNIEEPTSAGRLRFASGLCATVSGSLFI